MQQPEIVAGNLRGYFRDRLFNANGELTWERDWTKNAIVDDCRRLLSAFMGGTSTSGIQGLRVGAGDPAWDVALGPPAPSPTQTALVDPNPFTVPLTDLSIDFLTGDTVSGTPTNRLQIVATLGPGVPTWPDGDHATSTLREFGLVAQLDGSDVLINYRTHPAIPKDPSSTLERTIWLVF